MPWVEKLIDLVKEMQKIIKPMYINPKDRNWKDKFLVLFQSTFGSHQVACTPQHAYYE